VSSTASNRNRPAANAPTKGRGTRARDRYARCGGTTEGGVSKFVAAPRGVPRRWRSRSDGSPPLRRKPAAAEQGRGRAGPGRRFRRRGVLSTNQRPTAPEHPKRRGARGRDRATSPRVAGGGYDRIRLMMGHPLRRGLDKKTGARRAARPRGLLAEAALSRSRSTSSRSRCRGAADLGSEPGQAKRLVLREGRSR